MDFPEHLEHFVLFGLLLSVKILKITSQKPETYVAKIWLA